MSIRRYSLFSFRRLFFILLHGGRKLLLLAIYARVSLSSFRCIIFFRAGGRDFHIRFNRVVISLFFAKFLCFNFHSVPIWAIY